MKNNLPVVQTWDDGPSGAVFLLARHDGGQVSCDWWTPGHVTAMLTCDWSARFPVFFIFFSISVTLTAGLGLLNFYEEAEMTALWVPRGAKYRDDYEWVQENFPKQLR